VRLSKPFAQSARWRFVLLGVIVTFCAAAIVGCGGSDTQPAAPTGSPDAAGQAGGPGAAEPASPPTAPAEAKPAAAPGETTPPAAPAEAKPAAAPAETEPAKPKPQPPESAPAPGAASTPAAAAPAEKEGPSLPADIASWQEGDYLAAKQSRDPRFLDAVAYVGEQYSGDATAARLLATLLTTPEDPEPEPKPEPKVEKKPEKRPPSELSEFGPTESFPEGAGPMPEGPTMPMEEGMESRDGYVPGAPSDMPGFEGEGMGPREGALPPAPLAASYVSLTGGIIRALGANGTPEARHVLEELLLGKIPIGNERLAVGAVLRALVDYPNTENELLLYRVLTSPEEFRKNEAKLREEVEQAIAAAPRPAPPAPPARPAAPPSPMASEGVPGMEDGMTGRPPVVDEAAQAAAAVEAALRNMVSAEDLQNTALPLVMSSASMGLRLELAKYLIGQPSQQLGPRLQQLVTAANPLNVQAQIGFYRYANTPQEMRSRFEQQFTSYAADSLGRMIGVSTGQGADLQTAAVSAAGAGLPAAPKKVWSGFGDDPTQAVQEPKPGSRPGEGMPLEGGMMPGAPMAPEGGMMPGAPMAPEGGMPIDGPPMPEGGVMPGAPMAPEGGVMPGAPMAPEGGMMPGAPMAPEGGMMPEGGAPGGQPARAEWKPPKGPGEADKESAQKFEEVAASNPNLPYELARQFWNPPFVPALAAKLDAMANLGDDPQLIMLAAAIPTDAMRAQLYKTLQARWADGPEPLAAATGYPATAIGDPALILILKSLPRRMPPTRTRAEGRAPEPTAEQMAQFGWMHTVYTNIMDFCNRFRLAAENEAANVAETVANLPFKVHAQEGVSHCYAMDWQQKVANRLAGAPVDPLKVYYVRFEETGRYATVEGFYRRAVKSATERILQNGMWIEGMASGSEPGRRISMDVIIERPEFSPQRKPADAERLITQILYIEINNPAGATATASTTP
jgi:hypothetical protein